MTLCSLGSHLAEFFPPRLITKNELRGLKDILLILTVWGKGGCVGKPYLETVTSLSGIFSRTGFYISNVDSGLYVPAGP